MVAALMIPDFQKNDKKKCIITTFKSTKRLPINLSVRQIVYIDAFVFHGLLNLRGFFVIYIFAHFEHLMHFMLKWF